MDRGKVIKTSTYFSRKRVPMKRRRQAKTNYAKRQKMIRQDLKRPNYQQTRLVVRISGTTVTCQMVKAYVKGDRTIASACSSELRNYNITYGLKNFSACYLTGFLLGCRVMRQSKLHKIYKGNTQDVGVAHLEMTLDGQPATFRAILDMGLKASTKGGKVYAALKGVTDAGVFVPHSVNNFFGYTKAKKTLDSAKLRDRIMGVSLAKYAAKVKREQPESKEFSQYPADERLYPALVQQAINAVRKNPKRLALAPKKCVKPFAKAEKAKKKSYEARIADIQEQKQAFMAQITA